MNEAEIFATEVYDEVAVTEVIRPAAVVSEEAARRILVELALNDVQHDGVWSSDPSRWARFDKPPTSAEQPGDAELIGTIAVAYGTPNKYDITIYRVTSTRYGESLGWTVSSLCDDTLAFGGLDLATCPRADLSPPPKPFRFSTTTGSQATPHCFDSPTTRRCPDRPHDGHHPGTGVSDPPPRPEPRRRPHRARHLPSELRPCRTSAGPPATQTPR